MVAYSDPVEGTQDLAWVTHKKEKKISPGKWDIVFLWHNKEEAMGPPNWKGLCQQIWG